MIVRGGHGGDHVAAAAKRDDDTRRWSASGRDQPPGGRAAWASRAARDLRRGAPGLHSRPRPPVRGCTGAPEEAAWLRNRGIRVRTAPGVICRNASATSRAAGSQNAIRPVPTGRRGGTSRPPSRARRVKGTKRVPGWAVVDHTPGCPSLPGWLVDEGASGGVTGDLLCHSEQSCPGDRRIVLPWLSSAATLMNVKPE
jgi:hypothetical protein